MTAIGLWATRSPCRSRAFSLQSCFSLLRGGSGRRSGSPLDPDRIPSEEGRCSDERHQYEKAFRLPERRCETAPRLRIEVR